MSIDFKAQLRASLFESALPIFDFGNEIVPAASTWTGARAWIHYFRDLELQKGSRIILHLPESPAFIRIVIASLWEGYTLIPIPNYFEAANLIDELDANLIISQGCENAFAISPDMYGNPPDTILATRPSKLPPYPEIAFILRSSGTTGQARFSMLSLENVLAVVESHLPYLGAKQDARVLSVLPWTHCFGLVLELLPALLHPVEVHRLPAYGKEVSTVFDKLKELEIVHFNAVPLHLSRLKALYGPSFLDFIESGIVGGAPISSELAQWLAGSNLRVGYGQTEASPGICVGEIGRFEKGILGKACGCKTQINSEDILEFKGKNAFLGYWKPNKGPSWVREEWINTGDRVYLGADGSYRFLGRIDDRIKLPNGREINPLAIEEDWLEVLPIKYACLYSSDGIGLSAAFCLNDQTSIKQLKKHIEQHFPYWYKKLHHIHFLSQSEWPLSPKGDTLRNHFSEEFKYVY